MPIVNFVNEKKQIQVPEGANLRTEAIKAGIQLYNGINGFGARLNSVVNCYGWGHCGTCKVKILKGMQNASPMRGLERFTFTVNPNAAMSRIGNEETLRLACQVKVMGDMDVETKPEFNLYGEPFFK